ncbi:MAG: 6-phosphofructokinase [Calditrichaceae bacterium]|nr:6-phosphofructokinase [Calditrichaceae bacterium]
MPEKMPYDRDDPKIISLIKKTFPFRELTENEIKPVVNILRKWRYKAGEIVVKEGEIGNTAYIVAQGKFTLEINQRHVKTMVTDDFFGEIALMSAKPRMGTIQALTDGILFSIDRDDLEDEKKMPASVAKKIYKGFTLLMSSYMREGQELYNEMEVLLVQDGGCAPGYNPVTGFISEYLEKAGYRVFITAEGFKSLVSNKTDDYRCLIYNEQHFKQMDRIPGVVFSLPLRERRGGDFRSERYREFVQPENQRIAADNILSRKVKILIGIGGNGTFAGINALSKLLPEDMQIFFIPVTIDSDIFGSECIGEYTGVEMGAEKIRCYMADARTHKRCYIIEMMGAQGGFHALHSCLGAGADLAVLPSSDYDIKKIARALSEKDYAVIVVAEGYRSAERKKKDYKGNAAEYFRDEIIQTGVQMKFRMICEPFSRDIRGASPNNLDITLSQRMARKLLQLIQENKTRMMPAVLTGREYSIGFDEITTDNSVKSEMAALGNRLI